MPTRPLHWVDIAIDPSKIRRYFRPSYELALAHAFIVRHRDQTISEVFGGMLYPESRAEGFSLEGGHGKLFGVPCIFPDGNGKVGHIELLMTESVIPFDPWAEDKSRPYAPPVATAD